MDLFYVVITEQGDFCIVRSVVKGQKVVGMAASEDGARALMSTVSARKEKKKKRNAESVKRKHG